MLMCVTINKNTLKRPYINQMKLGFESLIYSNCDHRRINLQKSVPRAATGKGNRVFLRREYCKLMPMYNQNGVDPNLVGLSNSASGCDGKYDIRFLSRLRTCRAASDRVPKWSYFLSWPLRDRQSARFGPALDCRLFTIVVTIIDRRFLRFCPKSPSVAASRLRRWSQLPVGLI